MVAMILSPDQHPVSRRRADVARTGVGGAGLSRDGVARAGPGVGTFACFAVIAGRGTETLIWVLATWVLGSYVGSDITKSRPARWAASSSSCEVKPMKPVGIISPVAICLLFTAPAFARPGEEQQQGRGQQGQHAQPQQQPQQQRPHQENAGPRGPQRQEPHQAGRPQDRQQQDRPQQERPPQERHRQEQQQQHAGGQQERQREQRQPPAHRPPPQERRGQGERRAAFQDHRAHNWKAEHRNWQERGGYKGYRIPEGRYRGHFGPAHAFRLQRAPIAVVGGYPRFQYGGFRFDVVDPWPEYWSDDWYDNDDVYVDYAGDGYYLYNRRYPGDRIAITVNLN